MLDAIAKELVLRKSEISNQVATIYFGGGTPSLFAPATIQKIIDLSGSKINNKTIIELKK